MNFKENWPRSFRGEVVQDVNGRWTDDEESDYNSSSWTFDSDELKGDHKLWKSENHNFIISKSEIIGFDSIFHWSA